MSRSKTQTYIPTSTEQEVLGFVAPIPRVFTTRVKAPGASTGLRPRAMLHLHSVISMSSSSRY